MNNFTRRQTLAAAAAIRLAGLGAGGAARAATVAGDAPRERINLDFGWRFALGHASDPLRDFGFGLVPETFAKAGMDVAWPAEAGFDDQNWRAVDLPHDWAVELPFTPEYANKAWQKPADEDPFNPHGYKPLGRQHPDTSVGWYRKVFDLPASDLGRRISVTFDGVFRDAQVFFNGYWLQRNQSGYAPFSVDLTDFAAYGGSNVLAVRADASLGEGWFYEGAGIYRHVWLNKTDPVFAPEGGISVRANPNGALLVTTEVTNASAAPVDATLRATVFDPAGKPVLALPDVSIAAPDGATATQAQAGTLASPCLWSLETPHLYRLEVEIHVGGRLADRQSVRFGVRSLRFDPEQGFFLNDKPVKLLGTCNHQDHAGVGSALPDRLQYFRIEKLKSFGCNAYRTSHNPPTPELLDACDRLGMLVVAETRMMASNPEGLSQLERLVRRDRNHPSVILWSIGNEEHAQQGNARGARIAASMKQFIKRLDPTRLITEAVDSKATGGVSPVLDVRGFNYHDGDIDAYHAAFSNQPLIGTETASTVATRGEYKHDDVKAYVPAYDTEAPYWATTAEGWWPHFAARPFIAGGFIWTGFDYRGEPTPFYRWPSISSNFGVMDTCGFPKDNYFYYRAWWRPDQPLLHLFPHWNWEGQEGQEIPVWVHSNLDRVELFLNGKSQGLRDIVRHRHVEWKVVYQPGLIEAVGYKDGKPVLRERRETAGPAAALRLSADRVRIDADGADVSVLAVEVLDAKGRPVPKANNRVQFRLNGPGAVIGVGNGDPTCHEADKADTRSAFNGLLQAIVQSRSGQTGKIDIEAWSPGLKPAFLTVTAEGVKLPARL